MNVKRLYLFILMSFTIPLPYVLGATTPTDPTIFPGMLNYPLHDRYLRNWLVAGPVVRRITDVGPYQDASDDATKRNILTHYYRKECEIEKPPCEGENLKHEGVTYPWQAFRCPEDNTVSFSQGGGCVYLKAWAWAQLDCPTSCTGTWQVRAHGPVDVWINGEHALHKDDLSIFVPIKHSFNAALKAGRNEVLVRFEAVKIRVGVYGMSLRLPEAAEGARVVLPTHLPAPAARQTMERVIDAAYLDREWFLKKDSFRLHWADDLADAAQVMITLRSTYEGRSGEIIARKTVTTKGGEAIDLAEASSLKPGRYTIGIEPENLPAGVNQANLFQGTLSCSVITDDYSDKPYGTYESRRREALERAAARGGLYGEIAKMHLGRWTELNQEPFLQAIEKINRRNDTSDFEMLGLIGALQRYGSQQAFPQELKQKIEQCILGFKYWPDEPGKDVMWYWSENHQITFHACEILAGQLFPDKQFRNVGENGAWHRQKGERLALDWLRKRAQSGFHEWDSNTYFSVDLLALAHLVDLAETPAVRDMATIVLNKMLFTIALNSHRGVFGSTHARTYPGDIKSGRGEGTSGAARLMWGLGAFTDPKCYVSLALMECYRPPAVIGRIATEPLDELWSRERHGNSLDPALDFFGGVWEISKATWRTPDVMLCSAQDHRPGGRGNMQHIWQATLGPDAVAFVTHPPFLAESGSPNYWVGNLVLPRTAQWKDLLIDIRNARPGEGLGFTHAWFPAAAFDECEIGERWVFARKGDGYLALMSKAGIQQVRRGRSAFRELRSHADRDIWICQMGSRRQDGDFAQFKQRVNAMPLAFGDLSVRCRSIRGDEIAFGWSGPLTVNGKEVDLKNFPQYDSPFCNAPLPATGMTITSGADRLGMDWADKISIEQSR